MRSLALRCRVHLLPYGGEKCKPVCKNGKQLKDGKCVCPKGTVEQDDGACNKKKKKKNEDPGKCTSGLETGKCYTFRASNGHLLGRHSDNRYYVAPNSIKQRFGKFQLCKDEKCKPRLSINPSDALYIKDIHGQWLDEQVNGNHISVTPDFGKAGEFSISKWPCGKYCLGGSSMGLGPPVRPTRRLSRSATRIRRCVCRTSLPRCPRDIKDDKNNCIWANGADQCCDKMHCPA